MAILGSLRRGGINGGEPSPSRRIRGRPQKSPEVPGTHEAHGEGESWREAGKVRAWGIHGRWELEYVIIFITE